MVSVARSDALLCLAMGRKHSFLPDSQVIRKSPCTRLLLFFFKFLIFAEVIFWGAVALFIISLLHPFLPFLVFSITFLL